MVPARAAAPRSPQLAWFITGALAVAAVTLSGVIVASDPSPFGKWPLAALFFGLFWLAEVTVLRFEVKRQMFSVSLTEIPLLLALVFLPPMTVVVTRMAAVVLSQLYLRVPPLKICFNLSVLSASTALGSLVVLASPPIKAASPLSWLTLSLAVTLVMLTTLTAVVGVITLVQGRMSTADLVGTVVSCTVVAEINIVVGLVVLLVIHQTLWALVPLAGIAVVFVMAYRRYAMFVRQHKSLADLYDLTRAVGEGGRDGAVTDILLGRVRELLRAEYATLWLPAAPRHPEVLLSARADYTGLLDSAGTPDALRLRAVRTGRTVAVGAKLRDEHMAADLRGSAVKDAIVVPLRSGKAVIGTLEVAGRLGDTDLLRAGGRPAGRDPRRARRGGRGELPAGRPAPLRRLPRLADRAAQPAPAARRAGARRSRSQSHGEVVAVLLFDIAGLRRSTSRSGTRPATSWSPRSPGGCGRWRRRPRWWPGSAATSSG